MIVVIVNGDSCGKRMEKVDAELIIVELWLIDDSWSVSVQNGWSNIGEEWSPTVHNGH